MFTAQSNTDELVLEDLAIDTVQNTIGQIIVYNDEFNTFDWVISCFQEILRHTTTQAEQLAYIIHTSGKASVKRASYDELRPLKDALVDRGLSAVIEQVVS